MPYKITILWILMVLLSACVTNKKTDTTKNENIIIEKKQTEKIYSLNEIVENTNTSKDENITLQTKITFDFPYISNSANAKIEMAKMDSILINITGPFGINVGKLYANVDEFIMNNNLESETWIGKPTAENINKIINIPLNYYDLVTILRSLPTNLINEYIYNPTTNFFELLPEIATTKDYDEKITINDQNLIKSIIRIQNSDTIIINYDNYIIEKNKQVSRKIDIIFPKLNGKVIIEIQQAKINEKITSPMKFQKPKNYKLINTTQ